ncbi:MAG: fibronectin type III domain-containing protein [Acidobacteria bacterium]|nr:fibronectin type III domain-containing protein [Acidobacteriota bacterium]
MVRKTTRDPVHRMAMVLAARGAAMWITAVLATGGIAIAPEAAAQEFQTPRDSFLMEPVFLDELREHLGLFGTRQGERQEHVHATLRAVNPDLGKAGAAQTAPVVASMEINGHPSNGEAYSYKERVDFDVYFDSPIAVDYQDLPRLSLKVGTTTRHASFWWNSPTHISFAYVVEAEDLDSDGISIPANALASGGPIFSAGDRSLRADVTHEAVPDDQNQKVDGSIVQAPQVEGIFFQGEPTRGDVYGPGDSIAIGLHFETSVTVTGEPQVRIQIGEHTRVSTSWIQNDTHGAKLTFGYTVQPDDMDSDGVSIPANALSVEGGSITLRGRDDLSADLSHGGVDDDPARKVDGSLAASIVSISLVEGPDNGDTYTLGEAVRVAVEFDESVSLDSRVRLAVTVGSRTRQVSRTGFSTGTSFVFQGFVQPTDLDADGISIPANAFTLNGASVAANLDHAAVATNPRHKVDGSIAIAPKIEAVSLSRPSYAAEGTGFPVSGDTYLVGKEIVARVEFDKPVDVTGARPEVVLMIGDRLRTARLPRTHRNWGTILYFTYTVQADDMDTDGVTIPEDSLTLNGGTLTILGDASTAAVLTHESVVSEYKVDGVTASPPRVMYRGPVVGTAPLDGDTFGFGERIFLWVFLDRNVVVRGEPELLLHVGSNTRRASYLPEYTTRTDILVFEYLVQKDDLDADGFDGPANSFRLNGGSIVSAGSAAIAADLAHDGFNYYWSDYAVDGTGEPVQMTHSPGLFWPPVREGAYGLGDTVNSQVCFALPVEVSGTPLMALDIGGRMRQAPFHAALATSLGTCVYFRYTVQEEDLDRDGVSIPANALDLKGGAITLTVDDRIEAELSHEAVEDDADYQVDGSIVLAPVVTSVSFANAPDTADTYRAGEVISVRVAFDKALAVSGEPRLALSVGAHTRHAAHTGSTTEETTTEPNISKRNFFSLSFEYVLQPGELDADGISIPANALSLNGGSLTLTDSPGTAADLSHAAVNPDASRLVDAPDTAPTFSTAVAGQEWIVNEPVSLVLPEADGAGKLTYSLSPKLPPGMAFDSDARLVSGTPLAPTSLTAFDYTATDGDLEDPESVTLTFLASVIMPLTEASGVSTGDDAVRVTWRGPWLDPNRGRLVIEARSPSMDWTTMGAVEPSGGEYIVRGLEPETPYTFRLRFEAPTPSSSRSVSTQPTSSYSEEFSVTTGSYTGPCRPGGQYLCLRDGRFELRADWSNPDLAGDFGSGAAATVDVSDESGLFWFFDPDNIELVAKVLDGSPLNGYFWMYFGALSDVEYWLTLRDTAAGGLQRTYHNPPKEICGQSDVRAFPGDLVADLGRSQASEASAGLADLDSLHLAAMPPDLTGVHEFTSEAGECEPTNDRLCLVQNRFSVDVRFIDPNAPEAETMQVANVLPSLTTANTGFFWFFNRENIELAVKVLDGRAINGKFWLLYGGLSDVEYELTLTDTMTGESKVYRNEAGSLCGEIDTGPF